METRPLIIGLIIPLFLLGLLGFGVVIASIRRGEFLYKGGRWNRRDGWAFWFIIAFIGIATLGLMIATVWFGLRLIPGGL